MYLPPKSFNLDTKNFPASGWEIGRVHPAFRAVLKNPPSIFGITGLLNQSSQQEVRVK